MVDNSASAHAEQELNKSLKYDHHNQLIIMYSSKTLKATGTEFNKKINASLKNLNQF